MFRSVAKLICLLSITALLNTGAYAQSSVSKSAASCSKAERTAVFVMYLNSKDSNNAGLSAGQVRYGVEQVFAYDRTTGMKIRDFNMDKLTACTKAVGHSFVSSISKDVDGRKVLVASF